MVNKSWFINKVLEVTKRKAEKALEDMPDKDFEYEYQEKWKDYKRSLDG